MSAAVNIGNRLQEVRASRGLSIRRLSELSGLAINTLSLIENSKTSPSINTLEQLAHALQVPITAFFEPDCDENQCVFTCAKQRCSNVLGSLTIEDLGCIQNGDGIHPVLITVEPGVAWDKYPVAHTGEEFICCLDGCLEFQVGEAVYPMEKGDCLLFLGEYPHKWRSLGDQKSQIIIVFFPSETEPDPVKDHFGS